MTKLAPEWVRTSDPVIRSPARYRWTTAPAGIRNTTYAVQARFYWKGLVKDLEDFVKTCDPCQRESPSLHKVSASLLFIFHVAIVILLWRVFIMYFKVVFLFKDLKLDLRSWLPDIDQLRGWTELIKSLKLYYNTLRQTISNRHRNEFNLWGFNNKIRHSSFINIYYYVYIYYNAKYTHKSFAQWPVYDRIQWTGRTLVLF